MYIFMTVSSKCHRFPITASPIDLMPILFKEDDYQCGKGTTGKSFKMKTGKGSRHTSLHITSTNIHSIPS